MTTLDIHRPISPEAPHGVPIEEFVEDPRIAIEQQLAGEHPDLTEGQLHLASYIIAQGEVPTSVGSIIRHELGKRDGERLHRADANRLHRKLDVVSAAGIIEEVEGSKKGGRCFMATDIYLHPPTEEEKAMVFAGGLNDWLKGYIDSRKNKTVGLDSVLEEVRDETGISKAIAKGIVRQLTEIEDPSFKFDGDIRNRVITTKVAQK